MSPSYSGRLRGGHEKLFFFRDGVQEVLVDYFENVCQDGKPSLLNCDCNISVDCEGGVLHWIRSEDFQIVARKDVIVESNSIEECRALCTVPT